MAAQASSYCEERNRLRLLAREQRNQETTQAKTHHADDVPLFGELYRNDKREDALSNKIRMLLGSYEDGCYSNPCTAEPLRIPLHGNSSHQVQPRAHIQTASTSNGFSSQPSSTAISDHYGATLPKTKLNQLSTQQDLRDRRQAASELPSFLPAKQCENIGSSTIHNTDNLTSQHTQESTGNYAAMEVPVCPLIQSPKEGPLPRSSKGNPLLQQTFASLLSLKQPSSNIIQKPTAYVRPLDGQDQVVNESPDLKPPVDQFVPLQHPTIDHVKSEMLRHYLETETDGGICLEDILKELIHPLPPLLSPIRTPFEEELVSPMIAKDVKEDLSACPGQRSTSPALILQSTSSGAAAETKEESASSSESESSSRSESDSESVTVEPQPPTACSTSEADAPAVTPDEWGLGKWIRSSQQNSSSKCQAGTRVPESQRGPLLPSGSELVVPLRESQLSPLQELHSGNKSNPKYSAESSSESHEGTLGPRLENTSVRSGHSSCSTPVPPGNVVSSIKSKSSAISKSETVAQVKEKKRSSDITKEKTRPSHQKKSSHSDGKKMSKHPSQELNNGKTRVEEGSPHCPTCGVRFPDTCSCCIKVEPSSSPASVGKSKSAKVKATHVPHKNPSSQSHKDSKKRRLERKDGPSSSRLPTPLVVKIHLGLLSRQPHVCRVPEENPLSTKKSVALAKQEVSDVNSHRHGSKKTPAETVDMNVKTKKRKLPTENPTPAVKQESSCGAAESQPPKKLKKSATSLPAVKMESKHLKRPSEETKAALDPIKRKSGTHARPHSEKTQSSSSKRKSGRPLLNFENRLHSVKHYIKEAKRLKHKADAESDKLGKGFTYLDAAMYFVESGIAMKNDPQISLSSHTMFAETVELLKFVLKLKCSGDLSPSEKDFIVLCLKCQALLQMAMFQHKQKTALNYSKTLTDHFSSSAPSKQDSSGVLRGTSTPSPIPSMPSPASSTSSRLSGSGAASAVSVPQTIGQMTYAYVNITTLCLSAHDMWEQAEELAKSGSGLLTELDSVLGPLTLTSSVSSLVRYTRQGVAWLRADGKKGKMT